MERHRRNLYEKMQAEHEKKEEEILEYLNRHEKEQPSTSSGVVGNKSDAKATLIDVVDEGDLTDDEYFEMPLPPLPPDAKSPTESGQISITDNEAVAVKTPIENIEKTTPKIENEDSVPTRVAPPPPLFIPSSFYLPPLPPRPKTKSPESPFPVVLNAEKNPSIPTIVDATPKSMLESEL